MNALEIKRVAAEAASRDHLVDRWLVVSQPLAIDDDPDWGDTLDATRWDHEPAAA
jgi:hypothetical protein